VLTNAAKGIAEIITIPGYINTDFADVYSIMKDGKVAIMNTGYASGENRITKAIENALNSPLLNTSDVSGASKVLLSLYCSSTHQIKMEEVQQIHDFMRKVGENVQVIWGATFDDELEDRVKITLIATGYDVSDIPGMPSSVIKNTKKLEINAEKIDTFSELKSKEDQPENKEKIIENAVNSYYGKSVPDAKPKQEPEPELDLPVVNLDDLENDQTLKTIERIPTWKRKHGK
jgi:cell division protein FtsZ